MAQTELISQTPLTEASGQSLKRRFSLRGFFERQKEKSDRKKAAVIQEALAEADRIKINQPTVIPPDPAKVARVLEGAAARGTRANATLFEKIVAVAHSNNGRASVDPATLETLPVLGLLTDIAIVKPQEGVVIFPALQKKDKPSS